MDNKLTPARRGTLKILLLAVAVSVILNWSLASSLVSTLLFALEPVIYGVAVALALNAPTQWIEKLIARCDRKGVIKESVRTWIAVLLVLAIIGAVLYMAVTSMVPQMIRIFERVMAYLQTTDLQEKVRSLLNISVDRKSVV